MADDQATGLKAVAKRHESFFILGMVRIINQAGTLVQKNGLCFLEGNAVFRQIRLSFTAVPGKLDIAHSIILAIHAG